MAYCDTNCIYSVLRIFAHVTTAELPWGVQFCGFVAKITSWEKAKRPFRVIISNMVETTFCQWSGCCIRTCTTTGVTNTSFSSDHFLTANTGTYRYFCGIHELNASSCIQVLTNCNVTSFKAAGFVPHVHLCSDFLFGVITMTGSHKSGPKSKISSTIRDCKAYILAKVTTKSILRHIENSLLSLQSHWRSVDIGVWVSNDQMVKMINLTSTGSVFCVH